MPNEAAKVVRFGGLVSTLFPGTQAPTRLAAGIETAVRIDTARGSKRGRVDAYYGNAVIEFEKSLKVSEDEARRQLRDYAVGIWGKEGGERRQLLCVASDGVVWKTFRPTIKQGSPGKITAEHVILEPLRTLTVGDTTLGDFWIFLTSLLFRSAQTDPSPERFRVDFGATSPAFGDGMDALGRAWEIVGTMSEPQLAFDTWQRYLTVTYGKLGGGKGNSAELLELFLKHTYLASIARLLIWASLSKGNVSGSLRGTVTEILSGQFFVAQGIENLVEDDFFQWVRGPKADTILGPVWERLLEQMLTYSLPRLGQDVLKGVYQELVDPKDRHDLGEYYTPEWLCERVVAVLLPSNGFVSVLDPACGSGSFLRATIAHLIEANRDVGETKRLRAILDNVIGIDIHPLAVTISKATYLLAVRSLIKNIKRPIQIPVYLADSLFLPTEVLQRRLGEAPGYEIHFGADRQVSIPEEFIKTPEMFDPGISAAAKVAVAHAQSGRESAKSLRSYLEKVVPTLLEREDSRSIVEALWTFTDELSDLIKRGQNSIWAFIVRNSYRAGHAERSVRFHCGKSALAFLSLYCRP